MPACHKCAGPTNVQDDYGEWICIPCRKKQEENDAEDAAQRHMASFHDGGATQWNTLEMEIERARKLK